jgi:DNA/RNA endonuclease YhcR with UshA esterase domain
MHSSVLIKVALTSSLIGIISLFVLMQACAIPEHDISHIKMMDEGTTVKTEGMIKRITSKGNLTFIDIERKETMDVIAFNSPSLRLRQGDRILVEGKIESYKGETEIIADSIIKRG